MNIEDVLGVFLCVLIFIGLVLNGQYETERKAELKKAQAKQTPKKPAAKTITHKPVKTPVVKSTQPSKRKTKAPVKTKAKAPKVKAPAKPQSKPQSKPQTKRVTEVPVERIAVAPYVYKGADINPVDKLEKAVANHASIKASIETLSIQDETDTTPDVVYDDGRIPLDLATVKPDGKFFVYKIKVGNDYYVGFTSRTFEERINEHLECARNKVPTMLYAKLREYNFDYKLIELTEFDSELAALNGEREGIRIIPTPFRLNLTPGGEGYKFNLFKENGVVFFKPTERKHHE